MEDFVVYGEGVELEGGEPRISCGGYEEEKSSCGEVSAWYVKVGR